MRLDYVYISENRTYKLQDYLTTMFKNLRSGISGISGCSTILKRLRTAAYLPRQSCL